MTYGSLINRHNPWGDLIALQQEMNRLFADSMGTPQHSAGLLETDFAPAVDVLRDHDNLIVRADIPGIPRENIELTVQNNRLFIRGETKRESEDGQKNAHRLERFYGSFERVIDLPALVNPDSIKATFRDGVLEVTAAVREEAKPRQISLQDQ